MNHSPQAKTANGYDKFAFTIDWKARPARCPQGAISSGLHPVTQHGRDVIVVEFARSDCRTCPALSQCTSAQRRNPTLTLYPEPLHTARTEQKKALSGCRGRGCLGVCRSLVLGPFSSWRACRQG
ncbi:transposase, partial [Streptomyces sp. NPDC003038]|uniref:transposase n=1 Tax=unclassified Streptomyces TaxID=2593676 RepID=UPI0033B4408B